MNRRTFLAGAGFAGLAGLAGCISAPTTAGDRPAEPTPTPDGTPVPDDAQRVVSLSAVDDVPAAHEVSIDVELLDGVVTPASTARLRVTTTNEGDRRRLSVAPDQCALFNRGRGASERPGLWLHRPNKAEYVDRRGDRWVRNASADEPRAYLAYGCLNYLYETGESVSNEYLVWDDYQARGYMPPGSYRFAETVRVGPPDRERADETLAEFDWGFDVEVRRP